VCLPDWCIIDYRVPNNYDLPSYYDPPNYYDPRNSTRQRVDPEYTHLTTPHTITHPWWVGRGDLPSKAGEAVLAAGGALLEEPPGIYYYYSKDMVSPSCGHYDCTILYPLYDLIDRTVL